MLVALKMSLSKVQQLLIELIQSRGQRQSKSWCISQWQSLEIYFGPQLNGQNNAAEMKNYLH